MRTAPRGKSGCERSRRQPAEEAPGQAAAVVEDDPDRSQAQDVVVWNHSRNVTQPYRLAKLQKGGGQYELEDVMARYFLPAVILVLFAASPAAAEIVKLQSPHSVRDTMDRFEATAKQRGLTVFARI